MASACDEVMIVPTTIIPAEISSDTPLKKQIMVLTVLVRKTESKDNMPWKYIQ